MHFIRFIILLECYFLKPTSFTFKDGKNKSRSGSKQKSEEEKSVRYDYFVLYFTHGQLGPVIVISCFIIVL